MRGIVVIGDGAVGIAPAQRPHDASKDVLLVEAGERLGGRGVPRRRVFYRVRRVWDGIVAADAVLAACACAR